MAAGANADFLSLQLERVRPQLPKAYELEKGFGAKIKKVEGIETSSRDLRLPIQISPGGKFGYCTFAGTALGRGGASKTVVATLTPVGIRFNVELNRDVQYYTSSKERAIAQVLKKELENAVPEYATQIDMELQGDGTGVRGTSSLYAANVFTFAAATWAYGAQNFRVGQDVAVYNSTLATNRGEATITAIDLTARTVTVGSAPAGSTTGDHLLPSGMTGANPVGLFGLKYHGKTSGTWLTLALATYTNLKQPQVDALTAAINVGHVRLLVNQIRMRNGSDVFGDGDWNWYGHQNFEDSWKDLGDNITEITLPAGSSQKTTDLAGNARDTFKVAGFPAMVGVHADPTRVELVDFKNWGRGESQPIDFYKDRNGNMYFTPVSTTDGSPLTSDQFTMHSLFQTFVANPQRAGAILNIARKSGY
jgi:hypothetical protein